MDIHERNVNSGTFEESEMTAGGKLTVLRNAYSPSDPVGYPEQRAQCPQHVPYCLHYQAIPRDYGDMDLTHPSLR